MHCWVSVYLFCLCLRWKIYKKSVFVKVSEGNTDLPDNSLLIAGYNVKGLIKNDEEGIASAMLILYSDQNVCYK